MNNAVRRARFAIAAVLLGMIASATAHEPRHHHHHPTSPAETRPNAARVTLREVELVDVDGRAVPFKSAAVGNRIVIVSFIYTSCTTTCPVTSAVLAEVQDRLIDKLGARFGRDVKLISLSVDPVTDTPERLKDYALRFGRPAGWVWLTGEKPSMDSVLTGLGAYSADFTDHSGAILVGDARSEDWTRFFGVPNPSAIVDRVEQLLATRERAQRSTRGERS